MPASHVIRVELPPRPYDVEVGRGLLATLGERIAAVLTPGGRGHPAKAAVVTEAVAASHYLEAAVASLRAAGIEPIVATLPGDEDHKRLEDLLPAYDTLLRGGLDRGTPVVALCGGVVGDMAGFLAATLLRGLPLVQVPTTLLAMVDAAVGGKTGMNHAVGKNLIGAFHQPSLVLCDIDLLATLPVRQLHNGLAECVKHELIAGDLSWIEGRLDAIASRDPGALVELVARNVGIKAAIVAADPFESPGGMRAYLNLGHTFGHAMESVSGHALQHGEAVSLGTVAAAFVSTELGMLPAGDRDRITAVLRHIGLPTDGMKLDPAALTAVMAHDKKAVAGVPRFVLLEKLGKPVVRGDVPAALVQAALAHIA